MKKKSKFFFVSGRWVHPTTHPDKAGLAVRGPTHMDQIGPIRCPKWVGPLEMPSASLMRNTCTCIPFLSHFIEQILFLSSQHKEVLMPSHECKLRACG
jgi:hypothetical protein